MLRPNGRAVNVEPALQGDVRFYSQYQRVSTALIPPENERAKIVASMKSTAHCYIVTDERILGGEPIIQGTRTPVRAIVELWRSGLSPEAIPFHLPHLGLAEVFDALSYYHDHRAEIEGYIEENRIPDNLVDSPVE